MYPPPDPVAVPYASNAPYTGYGIPVDINPPASSGIQTTFGTEEYGTIQPGAAPGSGGSYTGVPNPSPSAGIPGIVAGGIQTIASASGVSRPSPTVAVPLSMANLGLWFSGASFGVPNWLLLGGLVVGAAALLGGRRR
jgi:hypothetical protein